MSISAITEAVRPLIPRVRAKKTALHIKGGFFYLVYFFPESGLLLWQVEIQLGCRLAILLIFSLSGCQRTFKGTPFLHHHKTGAPQQHQ